MISASRLLGAALGVCLFTAAATAWAEPSAAEKETARKLVKSGRAKKQAGDAKAALEDFKAAHAIMGVPTTGLELGKAQLEAGLLVEARDTLLGVSRGSSAPGESPLFAKARAEAKSLAKAIEPKVPQLTLELERAPRGVRVLVDDSEVPSAALSAPLSLNPGKHVIVARSGEREKRAEVSLEAGQARTLTLDLTALEPPPTTKRSTPPGALAAKTSPWVYVGFGVAGAGALVGGVTGVLALSKTSSVKSDCVDDRCPPATHDDIDSARTLGTVSTVAFVVAGIGAGIGAYALFSSPKKPADAQASRAPRVDAWIGLGNAGVRGAF